MSEISAQPKMVAEEFVLNRLANVQRCSKKKISQSDETQRLFPNGSSDEAKTLKRCRI